MCLIKVDISCLRSRRKTYYFYILVGLMGHHKNTTLSQRSSSTLNEQLKGLVNQAISLSYRRQFKTRIKKKQLNKINVILEMFYRLIFSDSGI